VSDPTEDFAAMFEASRKAKRIEKGQTIDGTIVAIGPEVEITTDSEYVLHGITKWIVKWKRRHWWRKNEP